MKYEIRTTGLNGNVVDRGSKLADRISVLVANTKYSDTVSHLVPVPAAIIPVAQSQRNKNLFIEYEGGNEKHN
jgi:hypothetical protein